MYIMKKKNKETKTIFRTERIGPKMITKKKKHPTHCWSIKTSTSTTQKNQKKII